MSNKGNLSLNLPPYLLQAIRDKAIEEGVTMAMQVRRMLLSMMESGIKNMEEPPPEWEWLIIYFQNGNSSIGFWTGRVFRTLEHRFSVRWRVESWRLATEEEAATLPNPRTIARYPGRPRKDEADKPPPRPRGRPKKVAGEPKPE